MAPARPGSDLRFVLFWPLFLGALAGLFLAGLTAAIGAFLVLSGLLSGALGPLVVNFFVFLVGACLMAKLGEFIRGLFEWL